MMRKFAVLLVALAMVMGTGLWWSGDAGTPSTTTSTSSTSSTTTTTLAQPASVCLAPPGKTSTSSCATWTRADDWSGSPPSIYTTTFAPFATEPTNVAYVAWIRTSTTDLALYPGYEGPGPTSLPRGPEMVPATGYPRLLAAFNSGFYEKDGSAGFYVNHTLYYPMIKGLATVVRYTNGTVDIEAWSGGVRPGPDVVMARQNLSMLVDGHAAASSTADNSLWGITLHGVPAVWRTALGLDDHGNLVYVAQSDVTALELAQTMVDLHVVRAMQLDINPEWPIFVTYAGAGAVGASLFVPNPNQISRRFLYSSTKDFFAVYKSIAPGEAQPW
jgi:hypothetical protein